MNTLIVLNSSPFHLSPNLRVFVDEFWIVSTFSEAQTTIQSFLGPFFLPLPGRAR